MDTCAAAPHDVRARAGQARACGRDTSGWFAVNGRLEIQLRLRSSDVVVLDRPFTYEPVAFALAAGDEPLRLIVDRTLTQSYTFGPLGGVYTKWFGEPDASAITFFRWSAIPE